MMHPKLVTWMRKRQEPARPVIEKRVRHQCVQVEQDCTMRTSQVRAGCRDCAQRARAIRTRRRGLCVSARESRMADEQPELAVEGFARKFNHFQPAMLAALHNPRQRVPYHAWRVRLVARADPAVALII